MNHEHLLKVIKEVHSTYGDDLCWMPQNNLDLIFEAAGLPIPNREVGDQEAMLKNCKKYVGEVCKGGGPWRSYQEINEENIQLRRLVGNLKGIITYYQDKNCDGICDCLKELVTTYADNL